MSARYHKLSNKLIKRVTDYPDGHYNIRYSHWCPACKELHDFAVEQPFLSGARWTWNGNPNHPYFSPSMLLTCGPWYKDDEDTVGTTDICHYFLHDGILRFLSDCTHSLAGQNVALPDVPAHIWLNCGIFEDKR